MEKENTQPETHFNYPVSINGKFKVQVAVDNTLEVDAIEDFIVRNNEVQEHIEGRTMKKVITIKNRIVNIVV